jgi:hypothetical protein
MMDESSASLVTAQIPGTQSVFRVAEFLHADSAGILVLRKAVEGFDNLGCFLLFQKGSVAEFEGLTTGGALGLVASRHDVTRGAVAL